MLTIFCTVTSTTGKSLKDHLGCISHLPKVGQEHCNVGVFTFCRSKDLKFVFFKIHLPYVHVSKDYCILSSMQSHKQVWLTLSFSCDSVIHISGWSRQGRLNRIIGPQAMQCTGALPRQPLTGIKMLLSIKLNIYLLYWYFQQNQCLNIKKTKNMLYTTYID
jgi:hypothetical protein